MVIFDPSPRPARGRGSQNTALRGREALHERPRSGIVQRKGDASTASTVHSGRPHPAAGWHLEASGEGSRKAGSPSGGDAAAVSLNFITLNNFTDRIFLRKTCSSLRGRYSTTTAVPLAETISMPFSLPMIS
jgi:hypothetical protein